MSYAYIKFGKNSMHTYDFVYDQTFRAYSDLGRSHEKFIVLVERQRISRLVTRLHTGFRSLMN